MSVPAATTTRAVPHRHAEDALSQRRLLEDPAFFVEEDLEPVGLPPFLQHELGPKVGQEKPQEEQRPQGRAAEKDRPRVGGHTPPLLRQHPAPPILTPTPGSGGRHQGKSLVGSSSAVRGWASTAARPSS